MILTIHRGTREIGGSCVELEDNSSRIVLDLGMPLVKPGTKGREPFDIRAISKLTGEELVCRKILPDIRGLYNWDESKNRVKGLIISHAHLDHYGFAGYVHPEVPIYASFGTAALIDVSAMFVPNAIGLKDPILLRDGNVLDIGPFKIKPHAVDHSAPDAFALEIEASGSKLFYSGDFRVGGRREQLFNNLIKSPPKNIDCMLMEGTLLGSKARELSDEMTVENKFVEVFRKKANLAFVFCSSQNVERLVSLYRASLNSGCTLVLDPYTAFVLRKLQTLSPSFPQYDSPSVRVYHGGNQVNVLKKAGYGNFLNGTRKHKIGTDEIIKNRMSMVMLVKTNRVFPAIARRLPQLEGLELIWSMWKGYLTDDNRVSQFCRENNLKPKCIHASGHADLTDLKRLASALKPKRLVPIHTFEPEQFKREFDNVTVVGDGEHVPINRLE